MSITDLERLLTEAEAAEYLQFTPRFLQARRVRGDGPPFVRVSSRAIRYRRSDLVEWVEQHVRTSTSDLDKTTS
jgi:predicted DNA-binding transcriptional regulator AlpA